MYLVGLRRSFPVAAYLAYALRHVDKRAYLVDGVAGMLAEQSSMIGFQGPADRDQLQALRPADRRDRRRGGRARKAQVIAISDSRLSPIARRADLYFEIKDAEVRSSAR